MSADEYISGRSVDWTGVARRSFGYVIGGAIVTLVGYVELLGDGIVALIRAPGDYYSWLIRSVFDVFGFSLQFLVIDETAAFLDATGPFAFPIALVIGAGAGYVMIRGITIVYQTLVGGIA